MDREASPGRMHQGQTEKSSQQVCHGTTQREYNPLHQRYFVESFLVLQSGQNVATTGDPGEPVFGLTAFESPQLSAKADGESGDGNSHPLGGKQVAQFVQSDE